MPSDKNNSVLVSFQAQHGADVSRTHTGNEPRFGELREGSAQHTCLTTADNTTEQALTARRPSMTDTSRASHGTTTNLNTLTNDMEDARADEKQPCMHFDMDAAHQRNDSHTSVDETRSGPSMSLFHIVNRALNRTVPHGGALACVFNMASAALGAGVLSLPSAFNFCGIAMSLVYIFSMSVGTVYSMNILAKTIEKIEAKTFFSASKQIFGHNADYLIAVLMIIMCFGGSVGYIVAMTTLYTPVLRTIAKDTFWETNGGIRLVTALTWIVFIYPFCITKRIDSFRHYSIIGMLCIVYFALCVVIHSVTNGSKRPDAFSDLVIVRTGNDALQGFGSFMFVFIVQANAFELRHEMNEKKVSSYTRYSLYSIVMCAVLYVIVGFFGYLDFGARVTDSVLTLYNPSEHPYMAVAYVGIVVKICVSFTLHVIPLRDALYYFFNWDALTMPRWKHSLIILIPCSLALVCGLYIPALNTVLGLVGSICGGTICFVLPALFYMYSGNFSVENVGWVNYISTYCLLFAGVVIIVFGTGSTVYNTVTSSFT